MEYVSYDDFKKMDMRFGLIRYVEPIEGADKLLRFEIDFGEMQKPVISCNGSCKKTDCDDCKKCDNCDSCDDCESCETCSNVQACTIHCVCETPDEQELPFGKEEYRGRDIRQIVSGIREYWPEYESLVGKYALYILNLEPREIRGVMSHGMLMAVDGVDGKPVFVGPQDEIFPGSRIR